VPCKSAVWRVIESLDRPRLQSAAALPGPLS